MPYLVGDILKAIRTDGPVPSFEMSSSDRIAEAVANNYGKSHPSKPNETEDVKPDPDKLTDHSQITDAQEKDKDEVALIDKTQVDQDTAGKELERELKQFRATHRALRIKVSRKRKKKVEPAGGADDNASAKDRPRQKPRTKANITK